MSFRIEWDANSRIPKEVKFPYGPTMKVAYFGNQVVRFANGVLALYTRTSDCEAIIHPPKTYIEDDALDSDVAFANFYQNQPINCTCQPMYNTSNRELDFRMGATQGCDLHCTHYGISSGGLCWCGWRKW